MYDLPILFLEIIRAPGLTFRCPTTKKYKRTNIFKGDMKWPNTGATSVISSMMKRKKV